MKKGLLSVCIILLIMLSGCIPSIHPIFTPEDRITDDAILGTWVLNEETGLKMDFTIQSDSPEDEAEGRKLLEEMQGNTSNPNSTWTFERAANITASVKLSGGSGTINLTPGAPSLLSKKAKITSKDELPFYILTHQQRQLFDTIETVMVVNLTKIGSDTYMDFFPYTLKDERVRGRFGSNFINGHTFAKVNIKDGQLAIQSFNYDYITQLIKEKRIRLTHENLGDDDIILTASTQELRAFIKKYGNDQRLFEDEEYLTVN